MYIPKRNRFEIMFLKRNNSTSSKKSSSQITIYNNNWSEVCTSFIKDVVSLKRRFSTKSYRSCKQGKQDQDKPNDPNLCLDQLSEFQKSYVSFPEFSDSTTCDDSIITDSSVITTTSDSHQVWLSSSTSTSTSSAYNL